MQQFRLIGLALFITAIFLALAAAITKTTHIRIQMAGSSSVAQPNSDSDGLILPPGSGLGNVPSQANEVQFTSVPIVWPLVIAAGMGLLMWFLLSSEPPRPAYNSKQRRRK